jgi:hypothetical protein
MVRGKSDSENKDFDWDDFDTESSINTSSSTDTKIDGNSELDDIWGDEDIDLDNDLEDENTSKNESSDTRADEGSGNDEEDNWSDDDFNLSRQNEVAEDLSTTSGKSGDLDKSACIGVGNENSNIREIIEIVLEYGKMTKSQKSLLSNIMMRLTGNKSPADEDILQFVLSDCRSELRTVFGDIRALVMLKGVELGVKISSITSSLKTIAKILGSSSDVLAVARAIEELSQEQISNWQSTTEFIIGKR